LTTNETSWRSSPEEAAVYLVGRDSKVAGWGATVCPFLARPGMQPGAMKVTAVSSFLHSSGWYSLDVDADDLSLCLLCADELFSWVSCLFLPYLQHKCHEKC